MKKKFLALVLTLAMVLSLVPATALAADTPAGGASQQTSDKLTMKKTVTPVLGEDGTYTVRLESYATGEVTPTTTTEPRDIVLLLDVSGSMGNPFTRDIEEYQPVYKNSLDTNKTYLIKQGWWYEEVTYCQKCKKWTRGCHDGWLTGNHKVGKIFTPTEAENDTDSTHTQFYQYVYISGKSKMDALKTAVNQFIEGIAENSPQSNISIVKFAGEKTDKIGNNTNKSGNNYTQIVKELTKVDNAERVNQLKNAVSQLQASGSTASDYGLEKAQEALKSANQAKVVVLFTDGEPNHSSGFDYEVATKAVNTAKILKDKSTTDKSTTIYTVGVFQNPSNDVHTYMSSVSSNYPNATAKYEEGGWGKDDTWTVTDGGSTPGTYYKTADSADELINAFKTISSQVSSTHLNGNAVVVDKVPSNFKAPANAQDVTLKVADYKADGTFDTPTDAPDEIRASVNGNGTVSVTGFNFSDKWCGLKDGNPHGQKLIIEFTIKCTNYGGTQFTNDGAYIKADSESTKEIISLENPTVPVTISLGSSEELLEKLKVEETKTYNGTGFAILSEVAKKADALVNGTNKAKNAYVDMELTVTVGNATYTYKILAGETAGKWYEGSSTTEMTDKQIAAVTTLKDVKRENNEIKPYTYDFNLKLSDKTEGGAEEANYGPYSASFTINPALVTVKAKDKTIQAGDPKPEYDATVSGTIGEDRVRYTISCAYNPATSTEAGAFDIVPAGADTQGNYTVTYQPGKLTVTAAPVTTGTLKVTKEVQGEDLTLKSLPRDFKITVTGPNNYDESFSLPEHVGDSDKTVTWTITDLPAGEYTVSESNAGVKDYTYTATYSATNGATVIVNSDASADQNQPATDSQKVTVKAGGERTMTVTNTYTKNATVDLSKLIKKELTVKKDSELPENTTFGVTVTPKTVNNQDVTSPQPIPGTVSALGNGTTNGDGDTIYTASFDFTGGTLSLPAGTYTYTVQETEGDVSGMQYDSDTYTLTIKVENSKATVKYTTGEGSTSIDVSKEKPLTIKNTYQAPDLSVTKQPYKVNGADFKADTTVAHVGEEIIWKVSVTNNKTTQASTQLKDTLGGVKVYKDEALTQEVTLTSGTWTARVPANDTVTYYVTYTVKAEDIPNGKIVNTIVMKNGEKDSDPVSTWDTKQLKSATGRLETSDWTTTVKLTLPMVNVNKTETTAATDTVNQTEATPIIAISKNSYVIDQIGNEFTFVPELTLNVGDKTYTGQKDGDTNTYNFGTANGEGAYPYTVTYIAKNGDTPAQFTWNINEDVYAGTKVTLSYKLKLTNHNTAAGTYGVEDLNGNGQIEQGKTPIYTNESAVLYKDKQEIAVFPKPSVSYTIKGSSGGHGGNGGGTVTIPDDVPTGLNGKDHYAYVVGYPDGMVYPQKNITRAEVATIFFRLLTDETREANMTKSNSYNDMKDGAWYTCAVSTLSKMGIIKGYEDGSFKPDASISRAEFAAIAARFDPDGDTTPATFSDVSSHWAKDEISIAANHGWIKGYEDGSFKPDQKITRAETMTLVNRVLKRLPETKDDLHKDMKTWPDNQNESAWFYLAVQEATNSHYQKLKKDGTHETWESMRETRDWAALEK